MIRKSGTGAALRIGAIIRARRKELHLTLDEVAVKTGVTKSFLSEVERDRSSPSVASLVNICEALNLPIGSLFASVGSSVVRADDRPAIEFGGKNIQDYLISPSNNSRVQAILSEMAPGGGGGEDLYSINTDEEFVLVLSGHVTITIETEEIALNPGDTLTFDPKRPHSFRNSSDSAPATAMFILSPPPR